MNISNFSKEECGSLVKNKVACLEMTSVVVTSQEIWRVPNLKLSRAVTVGRDHLQKYEKSVFSLSLSSPLKFSFYCLGYKNLRQETVEQFCGPENLICIQSAAACSLVTRGYNPGESCILDQKNPFERFLSPLGLFTPNSCEFWFTKRKSRLFLP